MNSIFKKSLIVAIITDLLDFIFHFFLTNPIESLTYFVIKFLLAFFVATAMFSSNIFIIAGNRVSQNHKKAKIFLMEKRKLMIPITGLIFSTLMSIYYRAWELGEARVPFGSRAPDIIGISRESILFGTVWWLGHALFFVIGVLIAIRLIKE